MVRKRVILLGLTLGLILNQFMLWQCNKVISAPNYSYTSADNGYSGYSYNNSQQYRNQGYATQQDINLQRYNQMQSQAIANNPYYGGDVVRAEQPYQVDKDELARRRKQDDLFAAYNAVNGTTLPTNSAQTYINNTISDYQVQMANQAGVPYQDYICQGNFQCIQQMYMNEQRAKAINNHADALRNQNVHVRGGIDVQYSGTVNVNQNINGTMYHYNRW